MALDDVLASVSAVSAWVAWGSGLGSATITYGADHPLTKAVRESTLAGTIRDRYYAGERIRGHQEQPGSDLASGLSVAERGIGSFDAVTITKSADGEFLNWTVVNQLDFSSATKIISMGVLNMSEPFPSWERLVSTPYSPLTPMGRVRQIFEWQEPIRKRKD